MLRYPLRVTSNSAASTPVRTAAARSVRVAAWSCCARQLPGLRGFLAVAGTVALCHLRTRRSMIGMLRWSDGECQVAESDAEPVSAGGVSGDVVVAVAQVLHEGVTDGEGPR